jgi:energy-coupling factor transporter ATP-binding protein EcfA2
MYKERIRTFRQCCLKCSFELFLLILELAIKCIKRIKALFEPLGIAFDSKETVINLNGCEIQAYPSNQIDALRSLTNPKFILLDEADFFRKSEQVRIIYNSVSDLKNNGTKIIVVSHVNNTNLVVILCLLGFNTHNCVRSCRRTGVSNHISD